MGNIAPFVVLGAILPFTTKQLLNVGMVILVSVVIGATVEIMQLLLRTGIFDIDDIILNALGLTLGYWCTAIAITYMIYMSFPKYLFVTLAVATAGVIGFGYFGTTETNMPASEMTIVLSLPSIHDAYYAEVFEDIVDFQSTFAKTIRGNDPVLVLADADTIPFVKDRFPKEILVEAEIHDIWMRDFTTVNPYDPVQFIYNGTYFPDSAIPYGIQESFNTFARENGITFRRAEYILDGGNIVDNFDGSLVATERFLEENNLSYAEGMRVLKETYGAEYVAIIPYDDDIMGHADGMVMFVDGVLFVHTYEEPFRSVVRERLKEGLPKHIDIVEVDTQFDLTTWKDFSSACGIYLNALVTPQNVYVPTFGDTDADEVFIALLKQHTDKNVHAVPAENVCFMGGSVRCLSWQIAADAMGVLHK